MEETQARKYRLSLFRVLILIYPVMLVFGFIGMSTDPTIHPLDYLYYALVMLPVCALPALPFILVYPVIVSAGGIVIKPQAFQCVFIKWDSILSVKPAKFLFFHYAKLNTTDRAQPFWLLLDMQGKSRYIDDLKESAPEGNPLRVYLETGELVERAATAPAPASPVAFCSPLESDVPGETAGLQATFAPVASERDMLNRAGFAKQLKNGANWFYWIAALSAVNTVAILAGLNVNFVIGLAATQIIDSVVKIAAPQVGGVAAVVITLLSLFVDILIAGVFVLLGVFANRKHGWVFMTGMVFYALDAILCLLLQEWLGAAFHLLALFYIFKGWQACGKLGSKSTPKGIAL